MPPIFELSHCVQDAEIDAMGHANNLCYLRWMLDAATAHSQLQGWSLERYKQLGAGWVVRAHKIEYLRPLFAGQQIVVRTWVAAAKRASSTRRYQIWRQTDRSLAAEALTDWAFVDFQSGRVTRVPAEVADAFVPLGDKPDAAS